MDWVAIMIGVQENSSEEEKLRPLDEKTKRYVVPQICVALLNAYNHPINTSRLEKVQGLYNNQASPPPERQSSPLPSNIRSSFISLWNYGYPRST